MKKLFSVLLAAALLCIACCSIAEKNSAEENAQPKILAVYSSPEAQIITNDDQSKALADTVIFLYQDHSYVQYVDHESRYEVYTKGTFEANFDWTEPGWQDKTPHILTIHADQLHTAEHQLESADLTFDVNLDRSMEYCLYPDNTNPDQQLVAAFMQVDKQKLVRTDGSETYLPTLWFYYDDGTFRQFAVTEGNENVLFSCGSYTVTDGMFTDESVLTIHRTQKYQDGVGLADYDSTHDYRIGDLDFIRVYPKEDSGFWISEITDGIFERIQGKSFKEDCTLPREDLRYLHVLHVGLDGETHEGEMIVNYHIAQDVLEILQQLYEAKYPIEKIRLVDEYDADDELSMEDNNSSSFNFRFISHTTRVSKHGLGLAVDINTLYNPYTKVVDGVRIVEPITGEPYLDREADFPCKIDHDDLCYRLFIEHGFEWGGDWEDRKDYQHFEIPTDVINEWYPDNQ